MVGAVEVIDVVRVDVVEVNVVEVDFVGFNVVVVIAIVSVKAVVKVVGTVYAGLPILLAGRKVLLGIDGEVRVATILELLDPESKA